MRLSTWLGLIRFSHTIFALPFAGLAAAMAFATPIDRQSDLYPTFRVRDLVGLLLCMVFARSAAMAFNRLVDRRIDADNPRTASRHIPAGILTASQVTTFTIGCCAAFVASTAIFLPNRWPLLLSIPVLAFLCGYSFAKRFTSLAHLWLGGALSLSPICVWVAIRGGHSVDWTAADWTAADLFQQWASPVVLALVVATWVTGFDIIYACQDAAFDSDRGLSSIPARFGVAGALKIAAICHLVMLGILACLPFVAPPLGWPFGLAVVVTAFLVIRQHRLVSPTDLDRVNQAFFDTNAAISVTLLVAGVVDCFVV